MTHIAPAEFHRAIRSPFYIYAPDYIENSSGIRVLNYLCHILNLRGEEAYVCANKVNEALWIPQLNDEIMHRHYTAGRKPIVIYPEVVAGTPLGIGIKIRYLLNKAGFIAGHTQFDPDEIFIAYIEDFIGDTGARHLLTVPSSDLSKFNPEGADQSQRQGVFYYYNRLLSRGGKLHAVTDGAVEISPAKPRSLDELAGIFKRAELLYCYEQSAIALEARLCGCPVVYIPNETMLPEFPNDPFFFRDGVAWGTSPEEIARAKNTVEKVYPAYIKLCDGFNRQLDIFVSMTQEAARNASIESCFPAATIQRKGWQDSREKYSTWRTYRQLIAEDSALVECFIAPIANNSLGIHICVRLVSGSESLLADTIDSLFGQSFPNWHLDIISALPTPEGLLEIPCISWHTIPEGSQQKSTLDSLVEFRNAELCVELPPGARLDPLCLWRISHTFAEAPKIVGAFVDDDLVGTDNYHHTPRFKPGVNQTRLICSDLAGPIFLRREAWQECRGASDRSGSPWYPQLLRVTNKYGWQRIAHVPDVLISYLDRFPSDIESCLIGLVTDHHTKGVASEVVPVNPTSWNVRYPLKNQKQSITIAVVSNGNFDFLSRCVNSITANTAYPHFEILVVVPKSSQGGLMDIELQQWLEINRSRTDYLFQSILVEKSATAAECCNAAVAYSSNEMVLLIHEEAVILQENWLEELVRTLFSPDVAIASPCMAAPETSQIREVGRILGLKGNLASPYSNEAKLGESGYLDILRIARDVSVVSGGCLLVRKAAYQAVGGMDASCLGDHYAEADLCQKLKNEGWRLVFQPLSVIVYDGKSTISFEDDDEKTALGTLNESRARHVFIDRWLSRKNSDPYWNPNLSLAETIPSPETDYVQAWQHLPSNTPRILAHYVSNEQGAYRVTAPLAALRKAGLVSDCLWPQTSRMPNWADLCRVAPDTIVAQNYLSDSVLTALNEWQHQRSRPFIVYALDDLITEVPEFNSLRSKIPANVRTRLKYALSRCDRMVVSTEYLAEAYRHLISDIRLVPNRLEKDAWLPLVGKKNCGIKPRIGWAGGITHHGDLMLLREVIMQTTGEADWIFFGMCPHQLRPLLAEYHTRVPSSEYPAALAALNLDIAVAPLAQVPFNRAKSNLRLLEYGILGIPVVCTDIDPYRDSPACRVSNSVDAWVKAIRDRIHDRSAREAEGLAMHHWVRDHYILENHMDEWLQAHLPD